MAWLVRRKPPRGCRPILAGLSGWFRSRRSRCSAPTWPRSTTQLAGGSPRCWTRT